MSDETMVVAAPQARPARPGDLPARDRSWLAEHGMEWEPGD
jgi:hypothetical protein